MQAAQYLRNIVDEFQRLKKTADRALAQISDEQLFAQIDPESNSLAMLMKHVGGNLRSRWTDFLISDGEKPDRNRDSEFIIGGEDTRATVTDRWEAGWKAVFDSLETLTPADLDRAVIIRGKSYTVVQAIHQSLTHMASHLGQIIFLAKHLAGVNWKTLSVPRGKSEEFNAEMRARAAKQPSS